MRKHENLENARFFIKYHEELSLQIRANALETLNNKHSTISHLEKYWRGSYISIFLSVDSTEACLSSALVIRFLFFLLFVSPAKESQPEWNVNEALWFLSNIQLRYVFCLCRWWFSPSFLLFNITRKTWMNYLSNRWQIYSARKLLSRRERAKVSNNATPFLCLSLSHFFSLFHKFQFVIFSIARTAPQRPRVVCSDD